MINTVGFFDNIFKNSIDNSILILNLKGEILDVNKGFTIAFGYNRKQLIGRDFAFLFTESDRAANIPAIEIKMALSKGSRSDNNYLLNNEGLPIWVLGESIAVINNEGEKYIIKIIQNINTQKKLEGFLIESNEFISTVFDAVKDAAFVILNSELNILRANKMFLKLFNLKKSSVAEIKLFKVENSFWRAAEIKKAIANILISHVPMKNISFNYTNSAGKPMELLITSKLMENEGMGRTILLAIRVK